jgi:two-component system response regulator TctD
MRTREFRLGDAPLALPPRERAVLEQLVMKTGETVSKVQIGDSIFGFDDEVDSSAIEIYVHRLRKKLEPAGIHVRTVRGLGYLLENL